MCHEFYKALEVKGYKPIKILGYLCTLFLIPIGVVKTYTMMMICASVIPIIIFIGMLISIISKLKYNIVDISITLLGAIYTVFMVAFLAATRAMPLGVFLLFYIIGGAWFSDIFAYLFGRFLGKHKFSNISPKKSIEGCIAGLIGSVVFFVGYSAVLNNINIAEFHEASNNIAIVNKIENEEFINEEEKTIEKAAQEKSLPTTDYEMQQILKEKFYNNYLLLILLGLFVSIISQIGDFAASAIKRYADIKDFSHLMPGHGGMLDRFDSILFVAPIVYYTFYIMIHI